MKPGFLQKNTAAATARRLSKQYVDSIFNNFQYIIDLVTYYKYLGLIIDKILTWNQHIKSKSLILKSRSRMLKTILSINKYTSLKNELLIYKTFLKPIWTYGLQFWDVAKKSNLNKIHTYQNVTLCHLTNAPPYISNLTLHNDLHVKSIEKESVLFYKRFFLPLANHNNPLLRNLNNLTLPDNPHR